MSGDHYVQYREESNATHGVFCILGKRAETRSNLRGEWLRPNLLGLEAHGTHLLACAQCAHPSFVAHAGRGHGFQDQLGLGGNRRGWTM